MNRSVIKGHTEGLPATRSTAPSRRGFVRGCLGAGLTLSAASSPRRPDKPLSRPSSSRIPPNLYPAYPERIPGDRIRTKLLELLGVEPIPKELEFSTGPATETGDGLRVSSLRYINSLGETVPALLIVPANARPRSLGGVVCMSGTTGHSGRVAAPRFGREGSHRGPLVGWGRELARRGFVTLSPTLKGTVARSPTADQWEEEGRYLIPYGRTLMGLMVDEALRAAEILGRHEVVDSNRIGLAGMSLGGNVAWYSMACAPKTRAAAVVCGGVGSMASVIHEGNPRRHSSYFYIPHMLRYFDHPQIVAECIAPRAFMCVAPTQDEDMPRSGVDQLARTIRPVYEAAGHPDRWDIRRPESGHGFTEEYFEWMATWLSKHC